MSSQQLSTRDRLFETANKLNQRGLNKRETKSVNEAVAVLSNHQSTYRRQKYKSFLHKVLDEIGPGAVLLYAVTFGQVYVTKLKKNELPILCNEIQSKEIQPSINTRAIQFGISRLVKGAQSSSLEQVVFGNATSNALTFNEVLYSAIRRAGAGPEAAVKMTFPRWGEPDHCLLSLDIQEQSIEKIALALFNAKVVWIELVLHIVLNEGTTMVIPGSEATLKGVKEESIHEMFGSEVYRAIAESPVRRKEIAEGKFATDCVSMVLAKHRAVISLCLDLGRGLELQKRLCA